jgi:hypothetical protein
MRTKFIGEQLAKHVNDARGDFIVWPSQKTLAAECDTCERTARTVLKELLDAKYLEIVEGTGGGGLHADGTGRTTHYKLRFPADDIPGNALPGMGDEGSKPGNALPGIENNPAQFGSIPGNSGPKPGNVVSETRQPVADKLSKELNQELNKELTEKPGHTVPGIKERKLEPIGERVETTNSEFHLPGIDYDSLSGIDQLPEGMVRQARDDKSAWNYASQSAVKFLGYEFGDKPDGKQPDNFVISFIPPTALAEILARCMAGTLTNSTVAMALLALRVPRGQHLSAPEPEPAAMHTSILNQEKEIR